MSHPEITIYSRAACRFCTIAKNLLAARGVGWTEISLDDEPDRRAEMIERTGRTSVPQIFIGDTHVGGCDDLRALDEEGRLDRLLASR